MKQVLITGANGFVGRALLATLMRSGYAVRAAVRSPAGRAMLPQTATVVIIGNVDGGTDWNAALQGIDVIVHLAARVHVMQETAEDPWQAFRAVNVAGTENLARQAAARGVKRFIYLSSIKVNGEGTASQYFTADQPVQPEGAYAVSKWEAECLVQEIARETGLETVIIRPPLIYGADVKGNFLRLIRLVDKAWPLPLAAVANKRSMVNLDNLCHLIRCCLEHNKAAGQVFLVADEQDLSIAELIQMIAKFLHKPAPLFPFPLSLLRGFAGAAGKAAEMTRLCGSLQLDTVKTRKRLGWQPPYSVAAGVEKTIGHYLSQKAKVLRQSR